MKTCILELLNTHVGVFDVNGPKRIYDPTTSYYFGLNDDNVPPEVSASYLRFMIFQDIDLAAIMSLHSVYNDHDVMDMLDCNVIDARKFCYLLKFIVGWDNSFKAIPQFTVVAGDTWTINMSNGGDNPSGEPPSKPSCLNA